MTDPRDIEQPEPRRVDSRGPQLADLYKNRQRAQREAARTDSRGLPLAERPRLDGVPEAREAEPTSPLTLADALEVELADEWHQIRDIPRLPRSERRG